MDLSVFKPRSEVVIVSSAFGADAIRRGWLRSAPRTVRRIRLRAQPDALARLGERIRAADCGRCTRRPPRYCARAVRSAPSRRCLLRCRRKAACRWPSTATGAEPARTRWTPRRFAPYVGYVHCKSAMGEGARQRQRQRAPVCRRTRRRRPRFATLLAHLPGNVPRGIEYPFIADASGSSEADAQRQVARIAAFCE